VARWEDPTYTNNRRNGMEYDAAGNLAFVGRYTFNYDATGQQTAASTSGYLLQQYYDGDGLRAKKTENGDTVYYLRSTVMGDQVVAELNASGSWTRGFVYQGGGLVAVHQNNAVYWSHEDPVGKSKRVTDVNGNVVSGIELDPFGGDTSRNWNSSFQPKTFTSYHRDTLGTDEAMFRRYSRWQRASTNLILTTEFRSNQSAKLQSLCFYERRPGEPCGSERPLRRQSSHRHSRLHAGSCGHNRATLCFPHYGRASKPWEATLSLVAEFPDREPVVLSGIAEAEL